MTPEEDKTRDFVFPKWLNTARPLLTLLAGGAGLFVFVLVAYGLSPDTLAVGYAPRQPMEYSHAMHAGELGVDCRYCHSTVEKAAHAALPTSQTCMNCHGMIRTKSLKITPLLEKDATNRPIEWVRVHNLPRFVYFDHSAHVNRGVACVSCHGRVDKMDVVRQEKPLSMGWCLSCHRHPEANLRPPEFVTKMDWVPPAGQDPVEYGRKLRADLKINPPTDCSACHR
jgi:hypothetical protein